MTTATKHVTHRQVITATKPTTKPRRGRGPERPIALVGGIEANRIYQLAEFLLISGLTRQQLSRAKQQGFIVRDAGGKPQVYGRDWLEFVKSRPAYQTKPRRPAKTQTPQPAE